MTPEIQQRIEQIRRGEIPPGYKYTKAGIMPDDWSIVSVGSCVKEYKKLSNDVKSIPVYSSSRRGLIPQSEYYDKKEAAETNLGYKIVPQNYVTYRHMSDDDIFHFNINKTGKDILVSVEYPVFTSSENCDLGFLIPLLNEMTRFRYFCRTQKLGGTRTRLYFNNLSKYQLGLPPLEEQRKIADILSTQDKVIELKERFIAEKQRQKKYLMQQLLTGKTPINNKSKRDSKSIGELCDILDKMKIPLSAEMRRDRNKLYPYWGANGIVDYIDEYLFDDELILLAEDGGNFAEFSSKPIAMWATGKFWVNNHAHVLKVKEKYCNKYIFYALEHKDIRTFIHGTTRNKLNQEDMLRIEISVPDDIEEQKAIAKILSAADEEIELLRRELEQEKRLKKALSRLLLTGIVRCI